MEGALEPAVRQRFMDSVQRRLAAHAHRVIAGGHHLEIDLHGVGRERRADLGIDRVETGKPHRASRR